MNTEQIAAALTGRSIQQLVREQGLAERFEEAQRTAPFTTAAESVETETQVGPNDAEFLREALTLAFCLGVAAAQQEADK